MQERTTEAAVRATEEVTLDPVDYAVISQALIAIAREMGTKLIRSSYSNIVREAQDASAALFDALGNVVAQAELIPMHLGSMSEIFRACVHQCSTSELRPGDFYINNDPYGGGQHLQDVFIFTPIFVDGSIVAFAGTVAHHLDLGGGNPGMTPDAVDVHAEGIIIPPSRYTYTRDWNGGPLERLVAANVRVPSQTIGDFYAQFAANAIGMARMTELCARYGARKVLAVMRELMSYSERRFRAALRAIPDGTYHGEDAVDDDGLDDQPLVVKAAVTIKGEEIAIDYAGTCGQVRRNLNCPWASTVSATLAAIKSALTSPDIPFNEGFKRPIAVTAPKGTLVNPNYPAPVRARAAGRLSLLQCRTQGPGPGGARSGRSRAATIPPMLSPSRISGPKGTGSTWRSTAAALAADRGTTAAMPSTARSPTAPTRRSRPPTWTSTTSGSSATGCCPTQAGPASTAAAWACSAASSSSRTDQLRHLHRSRPPRALRVVRRRRRQPHAHRDRARWPGHQAQEQGSRRPQGRGHPDPLLVGRRRVRPGCRARHAPRRRRCHTGLRQPGRCGSALRMDR